jgi:hypothetical protein
MESDVIRSRASIPSIGRPSPIPAPSSVQQPIGPNEQFLLGFYCHATLVVLPQYPRTALILAAFWVDPGSVLTPKSVYSVCANLAGAAAVMSVGVSDIRIRNLKYFPRAQLVTGL